MSRYLLRPAAERDLEEIWRFSNERWGPDQADRYIVQIVDCFVALGGEFPPGQPCDDIRPGYRKARVGSHIVFYRSAGADLEIVRILHQSMDFDRHL